jgi:hypothetical protein
MHHHDEQGGAKMAISVQQIEAAVAQLSEAELKEFRAWYVKFDSQAWDEQIEADISAGKLDELADQAVNDYKAGRAKEL